MYPKARVVIDGTEICVQTPSFLEVQSFFWNEYKHCIFKLLICITPNGAISWISPTYGGGSSDLLEQYACVMADLGFKIKNYLLMR